MLRFETGSEESLYMIKIGKAGVPGSNGAGSKTVRDLGSQALWSLKETCGPLKDTLKLK